MGRLYFTLRIFIFIRIKIVNFGGCLVCVCERTGCFILYLMGVNAIWRFGIIFIYLHGENIIRYKMNNITICCNVGCPQKFSCGCFSRAMDVNAGKIVSGYAIIECINFNYYEKG